MHGERWRRCLQLRRRSCERRGELSAPSRRRCLCRSDAHRGSRAGGRPSMTAPACSQCVSSRPSPPPDPACEARCSCSQRRAAGKKCRPDACAALADSLTLRLPGRWQEMDQLTVFGAVGKGVLLPPSRGRGTRASGGDAFHPAPLRGLTRSCPRTALPTTTWTVCSPSRPPHRAECSGARAGSGVTTPSGTRTVKTLP